MMSPFLAQVLPSVSSVWVVLICIAGIASNIATVVLAVAAFKKQKTLVAFDFVPAGKAEFDEAQRLNHQAHLDIYKEINRLKSENLTMTREIGKITNETLAALANARLAQSNAGIFARNPHSIAAD